MPYHPHPHIIVHTLVHLHTLAYLRKHLRASISTLTLLHLRTCVSICTLAQIYAQVLVQVLVHLCTCACTCVLAQVLAHLCICACTCTLVLAQVLAHLHTYAFTHLPKYLRTSVLDFLMDRYLFVKCIHTVCTVKTLT